jgi:hypothetical protein
MNSSKEENNTTHNNMFTVVNNETGSGLVECGPMTNYIKG